MKKYAIIALLAISSTELFAFCGFYVAKADAKIFNKTSQVILVRDGDYSVVTMSNDFKGDAKDFAMVVPVPVVLNRQDIRTVNPSVFNKLDAYSGPRLVEYHDNNPCYRQVLDDYTMSSEMLKSFAAPTVMRNGENERKHKVTIEAEYKVDEYDILILSAKESTGLKSWLTENGYKIPGTAAEVLDPYIKNNLKFFVVKVDAERLAKKGTGKMSPLQIGFNSPKFMLPIRLGMANADGDQDMIVYGLTKTGRIECTNYRTVEVPTARNIPTFVRNDFGNFYKDLFDRAYKYQGRNAVFLEYAWNVSPSFRGMKCDPCVGPPPISRDLSQAGVYWSGNVHFTRLHVRYSKEKFAQDLLFQVTPNKENFQGRYIITNPARGPFDCDEGQEYLAQVVNRRQNELAELQALTGWTGADHPNYVKGYKNLIKDAADKNEIILPIETPNDDGFIPKLIFSFSMVLIVLLLLGKSLLHLLKRRIPAL
jgi:hypothetical protein